MLLYLVNNYLRFLDNSSSKERERFCGAFVTFNKIHLVTYSKLMLELSYSLNYLLTRKNQTCIIENVFLLT